LPTERLRKANRWYAGKHYGYQMLFHSSRAVIGRAVLDRKTSQMQTAFVQIAANQGNINSLGFTSRNSLSVTSKLVAYAAMMVIVPESQWP
jgi:hypothetical protein